MSNPNITTKMISLNQMLVMGFTSMIREARSTVKGFVIEPANPNPQARIQQMKPVKESYPIITQSAVIIGSMVSISSNSPRNEPKQ